MSRMMHNPRIPVGEKVKHKFSDTWSKLIRYCKAYLPTIILALVCAVGGTVFTILGPDKIKQMSALIGEGIFGNMDFKAVTTVGLTLVAFYASSILLSYLQSFIMTTVTQKITKKMRNDIAHKINSLPLGYFDKIQKGDILSRVTNDVDILGQTLNQSIANLVSAIVLFVGSIVMMFVTNWIMALVAIGSSLVGFVFMAIIVARSQKYHIRQQKLLGDLNGHIEEVYSGHNVIKAYNAEIGFNQKFETINKKLYKNSWKAQFMSGLMMPLMHFIGNLGYVAVCIVGAILTKNDPKMFDIIPAFLIYVNLFTQPLSTFAQSMSSLQSAGAASFRVFEFLEQADMEDESHKTQVLENAQGNIEFRNVKFGYDPKKIVVKDFSATVKKGQKVAIVGPTGAGKTTMVNLLMRFYEINEGEILIDGISTKDLTRENVHELFCMVLQDTWLFEGTIRDNIVYNNNQISDEQIETACRACGLHHFIQTLPNGYNTMLNEDAGLSAGQKQLVTIARAMVDDAPMLILDEATSNVDSRTEIQIQTAMTALMENKTCFIIAHRLSTIKSADEICVLHEGEIVERGTHDQLVAIDGYYKKLNDMQK